MSNFAALEAGYIDTIEVVIIEHKVIKIIEFTFIYEGRVLKK